jgi:fructosamine-3-kinase
VDVYVDRGKLHRWSFGQIAFWQRGVELKQLSKELLDKVIPRLLRSLETQGQKVSPSLLHGDLWVGNAATNKTTGQPMGFDSSAYYGHHECESEVYQTFSISLSNSIHIIDELSTLRPMNND